MNGLAASLLSLALVLPAVARAAGADATFDAAMRDWLARRGVGNASIAVMRDDRLVFAKGYGARGANERIGVWSLSKAITALCIVSLIDERRLELETPIGRPLAADFATHGRPDDPRMERLTVRQLLEHRGGLPRLAGGNRFAPGILETLRAKPPAAAGLADLRKAIRSVGLVRDPGSDYEYSNIGYLLLGEVVEALTGAGYEESCGARVLAKAGIAAPGLEPTWGRLLHASAGWHLSGPEYLAFARLLRPRQAAVLSPQMHAWLRKPDGRWVDGTRLRAYTLGVMLYMQPKAPPNIFHGGGWVWTQGDAKGGPIRVSQWTWFVLANDGTAWLASFEGLPGDSEQEVFHELDRMLWRAKAATTSWPARDLFPSLGIASVSETRRRQ